MTKTEAITLGVQNLRETGITQFVLRRGDKYQVHPADVPPPTGWKTAEMISRGNVHNYRDADDTLASDGSPRLLDAATKGREEWKENDTPVRSQETNLGRYYDLRLWQEYLAVKARWEFAHYEYVSCPLQIRDKARTVLMAERAQMDILLAKLRATPEHLEAFGW